ncbi:MAG: hypothetical protein OMM_06092 [Candidatus Magnetoglobus multicellularis str. Araruama]|uniref:NHL repeat containing protein n=1 Tax=Candidatus Magnetoglobus multicellularis str. Araruama TaxID=890399 RepID=A0A1V1NRT5_9BACT|nr:MAG: hypothetical protein OMM_06092 [Candidatus Magnetoglobus multicellularis str. Araruama]
MVTDDGNIPVPDGSITASKLANNPGNGTSGDRIISNGDGSFGWESAEGAFTTTQGSDSASLDYSFASTAPYDVTVDSNGNIYVCEFYNHRVMVYTASGDFSYSIGTGESSNALGSFHYPNSIEVDSNGKIYVCEQNNHRIQVLLLTVIMIIVSEPAYKGLISKDFSLPKV